ncbi:MAG: oligosaccharide flippase family protein, partial [Candidatus Omnitrophica bacterium]|nr:oligosaccharide flippase family protein [Candidatus Omnitrophota bacterium]
MLKKITKNTSIVSLGTGISMLLGLVRDVLVAQFFGTTALLESFIVAFRLPNLFRSIFGEGFADSVATPVLSELNDNKKKLFETGNNLLSLCSVVLLFFTLLGVFFAKYLVMILAPGFVESAQKFSQTVSFARITFLYLFFIGLSVNSFALLYSLKRFFIPSITPAFLNVSFVIGLLFFSKFFENYILVVCVLSGGILQVILPFYALRKQGFQFKLNLKTFFK